MHGDRIGHYIHCPAVAAMCALYQIRWGIECFCFTSYLDPLAAVMAAVAVDLVHFAVQASKNGGEVRKAFHGRLRLLARRHRVVRERTQAFLP